MSGTLPALISSAVSLTGDAVPKAVSIIGDDIAANGKQLMGLPKGRNLPALMRVATGSLYNKAGTIAAALALSWAAPFLITPLLAVGGFYLTAEAAEQLRGKGHGHKHGKDGDKPETEDEKVKNALKVDIVLSGEITALTLGIVAAAPLLTQFAVMAATGVALTGILYGTIGAIIGIAPAADWLKRREGDSVIAKSARKAGEKLEKAVPGIMKTISVVGIAALFMVGGELLLAGIPAGAALLSAVATHAPFLPGVFEHVAMAGVGLAASLVSYPLMERLEEPLEKLGGKISKGIASLKEKFKKKPAAPEETPDAPAPQAAPDALKNVPTVKADMNAAAAPVVEQKPVIPAPPPAPKAP